MDWAAAITERRVVSFNYRGHERIVIPAAFGLERHTGNAVLRGYQIAGTSTSEAWPPWRLFLTDLAVDTEILPEIVVENPPGYRRGDSQMAVILAER